MSISLKEQLLPINEISYHAPIFGGTHYDKSHSASNGHGKDTGIKDGRRMFYDFYAMEFLWSFIGSGTIPKADREKMISMDPDDPRRDIILSKSYKFLPQAMIKTIDNIYEQVTNTVAKNLLSYVRLAVVQEFQYLVSQSHGWSNFRQAIVSKYNINKHVKNAGVSKEEFQELVKKHIPEMQAYPETVKKLLKFSKYFSKINTSNDRDSYDVTRKHFKDRNSDAADDLSVIDPKTSNDTTASDPDDTNYDAKPVKRKFGKYGNGVKSPYDKDWTGNSSFNDVPEEPSAEKSDTLNEELINTDIIKNVYAAMNKAGLTMDDIKIAYNKIKWGGGYGGPRWGEGAIALLKLQNAKKNLSTEDMNHIIDHIYDLQHNTGSLLNKGPMNVSDEDLNRRYRITNIARFIPFVSPVVKNLILRYQKYLHADPSTAHDEANMETMLTSPKIGFEPEQIAKLTALGMQPMDNFKTFTVHTDFKNKKDEDIGGGIEISKHLNSEQNLAKFIVADDLRADVKAFNSFDEALHYITQRKHQFSAYQPAPAPKKVESSKLQAYLASHTKIKLGADMEQRLLDIKMAYRPIAKVYKAYFQNGERIILCAFTDGSFVVYQKSNYAYHIFETWADTYNLVKLMTKDAMDNPYAAEALANLGVSPTQNSIDPFLNNTSLPHYSTPEMYKVHTGIDGMPKHSIRLTKVDEAIVTFLGFIPKMNNGSVYYIHKNTGDTLQFYPNNIATLSFKGQLTASVTTSIRKIIDWLPKKYDSTTTISPILVKKQSVGVHTPIQQGTKAGIMFEKTIMDAGFNWDAATNQYIDGTNTLNIAADRSSVLSVKAAHGGALNLPFKDLASLIAYLKTEYPTQKKSSGTINSENPNAINVDENYRLETLLDTYPSVLNLKLESGLYGMAIIKKDTDDFLMLRKKNDVYVLYIKYLGSNGKNWNIISNSPTFKVVFDQIRHIIQQQFGSNASPISNGVTASTNVSKLSPSEINYFKQMISGFPGVTISKQKNIQESREAEVDSIRFHDQKGHNYIISKNDGYYETSIVLPDSSVHLTDKSPLFLGAIEFIKGRLEKVQKSANLTNRDIADTLTENLYNNGCLGTSSKTPTEYYILVSKKIAAIKIIRTFIDDLGEYSSLWNAKFASENFTDFIKYIRENGMPEMRYSNLSDTLITWNSTSWKSNGQINSEMDNKFQDLLQDAKMKEGISLAFIGFDYVMSKEGFLWNESYKAYINKNIYQIVVVKVNRNKYTYHVFYISGMGIPQQILSSAEKLLQTIGINGFIIGDEKKKSLQEEMTFKNLVFSII